MQTIESPTIIVIFGITGDLSKKKLIPALLDLESSGLLPKKLRIIGFSRRDFSENAFSGFVHDIINSRRHGYSPKVIKTFCSKLSYCPALFDDAEAYARLGEKIYDIENNTFGVCANKLYYLATPPLFYETIFRQLADSGLTIPCGGERGWARILVEKPFGRDIETAQELDLLLGKLFREEQIFRIDHYLAKEAVQNLIMFRFSNALFEPLWNHRYIDQIDIKLFEKDGVGGRGAFYDGVGALRDVGQNHMLQMLGVIAMEKPLSFNAECIRKGRTEVFKALRLAGSVQSNTIRGQYRGYKRERGVRRDSDTETYFRLRLHIKNRRWKDVPVLLESGKALKESKTEIAVYFKPPARCLACGDGPCTHRNTLTFRIQPNEGISVRFWVKKPGFSKELEEKQLSFTYSISHDVVRIPDAYEHLLFDALTGDQTLFASTEEVQAEWRFITPILESWKSTKLRIYKEGSAGVATQTKK
jgi:glucose-6-phosphate 1-dehydrogenase